MIVSVAETRRPLQQDRRHYLPRWMIIVVAIVLIQELTAFPSSRREAKPLQNADRPK